MDFCVMTEVLGEKGRVVIVRENVMMYARME